MKLLSPLLALATATSAALTYKGVDWSSLLVEEAAGRSYIGLNGVKSPLETILAANGVNTVRQRLWVNPSDKTYNLDYNLRLARRAHAANLKLYLDLHFSDTWADPAHQKIPSGWPAAADIDNLAWKLYNYTLETSNAFASAGLPIALLSLGNEITAGTLFPAGQLSTSSGPYNLARLLHSAAAGVKDSKLSPKPKLMLHLDNGWNFETQQWWYDTLLKQGPLTSADFDVQGVSYYPFYNEGATLVRLKSSLTAMRQKYGKEIMVVGRLSSLFRFFVWISSALSETTNIFATSQKLTGLPPALLPSTPSHLTPNPSPSPQPVSRHSLRTSQPQAAVVCSTGSLRGLTTQHWEAAARAIRCLSTAAKL
jgi:arabinogalactan endo-1,4-beta-galactosidase